MPHYATNQTRGAIQGEGPPNAGPSLINPSNIPLSTFYYDGTPVTGGLWQCNYNALNIPTWVFVGGAGGGGITPTEHATLRQLIHLADGVGGPMEEWPSGSYREILPAADPFPTLVTWWVTAAKTKKIVQKDLTYAGVVPTQIKWTVYAADGTTAIASVTDTITYVGVFETSRLRTVT
jgi:hypothetical protein